MLIYHSIKLHQIGINHQQLGEIHLINIHSQKTKDSKTTKFSIQILYNPKSKQQEVQNHAHLEKEKKDLSQKLS